MIALGTWRLATGNAVDVTLDAPRAARPYGRIVCRWDRVPLSRPERREYLTRVRPALLRALRLREALPTTTGRVLVLTPGLGSEDDGCRA